MEQVVRGVLPHGSTQSEVPQGLPGDLITTAYAIELMETYGIPEGLELNWVRSFLKPRFPSVMDEKGIAATALERLNHLPAVPRPSWLDYVYYERTLLVAVILVGLCLFATLASPNMKVVGRPMTE